MERRVPIIVEGEERGWYLVEKTGFGDSYRKVEKGTPNAQHLNKITTFVDTGNGLKIPRVTYVPVQETKESQ